MAKALSGALSLLLVIMVLRLALPEVAGIVVEILVKTLSILNNGLDITLSQVPSQ